MRETPYDQRYTGESFYWGKEPSPLAPRVVELIGPGSGFRPKLLDLGCGEGRDSVYFARYGFEVIGLDLSPVGLEKAQRYAAESGVQIRTIHADVADYALKETYGVIFSTGTLHFLPPETRRERFEDYKTNTTPDGVHFISVFVDKPFIPSAPDSDPGTHPFRSGELTSYYWDWEIVYCAEEIFARRSSGVPHKHCVDRIIARRYRAG